MRARLRSIGLVVALFAGTAFIAAIYGTSLPLENWLIVRLAPIWLTVGLFAVAVASAGNRIITAILGRQLPASEHWVLSAAAGVLAFFLVAYVGGLMHLMGRGYFLCVPFALVAVGFRALVERLASDLAGWRFRDVRLRPIDAIAFSFVAVCLVAVILPIVEPANLSFDAQWYHVPLAEHYVAAGGIVRFADGRLNGAMPHLVSVINAWALHFPLGGLWDRLVLIGHLEALMLVATVCALPTLCRAIAPAGHRWTPAVAVFFFFPSIFVYDTGIIGGADHWIAFFSLAAWLALLRFWPQLDWRSGVVFAVTVAAMCLTKYSVAPVAAVLTLALGARALQLWRRWRVALFGLAVATGVTLVLTSPHWLKNWLWYGAPMYPLGVSLFSPTPWTADSAHWVRIFASTNFIPQGDVGWEASNTLAALFNFSYAPRYAWQTFHTFTPAFGTAFTALILALPFLRAGRRVWGLTLVVHGAIAVWYVTSHQERYLLILVPWMAALLAVIAVLAWVQGGVLARIAVVGVGAVQLVGAADLPFFPSHAMHGQSSLAKAFEFLSQGYRGNFEDRFKPFNKWESVGKATPRDATVLVHKQFVTIGLQRRRVDDLIPHQYGISWGRAGSLEGVHRMLKHQLGVTHIAWDDAYGDADSVAGELLFHAYLAKHVVPRAVGSVNVGEVRDAVPPPHGDQVQYFGCGTTYETGLYTLAQLTVAPPVDRAPKYPAPLEPGAAGLGRAHFAVVEDGCAPAVDLTGFDRVGRFGRPTLDYYVRATPR